jgi:hypothetical protein
MVTATGSLSDYLRLIQKYTPIALIDESQWDSILEIGDLMPSSITNFFGFECRLGTPEARADFLFCSEAAAAGRRVLAANAYDIDLPKVLLQQPVWQNLRQFSTNWESPASVLHSKVHNVWLEFDTATPSQEPYPVPSCFFGPEPLFAYPAQQDQHPADWVWSSALPLLLGRQLPLAVEANLLQCIEHLPSHAYIFQIGLMLARNWDGVRLCIRDIAPDDIINYLSQLNWSGKVEPLQQLLQEVAEMTDRIDLDIDVSDRIQPKIGLECYLKKQPKFDDRWGVLLDTLVLQGKCSVQKRQALMQYAGYIREQMEPERWPSSMRKLRGLLGPNYEWIIFKGIHHLKLVYHTSQVTEAKAYLYVCRSLISNIVQSLEQEKEKDE